MSRFTVSSTSEMAASVQVLKDTFHVLLVVSVWS